MIRLFAPHPARPWTDLDGTWTYFFPRTGQLIEPTAWAQGEAVELEVPGGWDSHTVARYEWRGQAIARRMFRLDRPGPAVLHFAGVGHSARVLVDGVEVGHHHDGHTGFTIELAELAAGPHEILVQVDSRFGPHSVINSPNDYFIYSGLVRPVELHRPRRALFIRRVDATPERLTTGGWKVHCTVHLANPGPAVGTTLRLALGRVAGDGMQAGGSQVEQVVQVPSGGSLVELELTVDLPAWSPSAPNLHWLEATLSGPEGVFDGWHDRLGLRQVRVDGDRILLNGEPLFLAGVNRHEDHPEHGASFTIAAMRKDLELIRALGCNAVRTSHYPNDERFLDLCDEQGFLVWEENHARGQATEEMIKPGFREQTLASAVEMVEQHRNHPSIILWGIMNECGSDTPEGRVMYAEQFAAITARDVSRPTTFASCRAWGSGDLCQDLPDVASWNIYPGWYHDQDPSENIDMLLGRFPAIGGKPFIVSEIGASGIPGMHDPIRRSKWSLERQADILFEQVRRTAWHPRVCGVFIWQFCDVRVDLDWWNGAVNRPGGINDKGLVDGQRRPKPAYAVVAELFRRRLAGEAPPDSLPGVVTRAMAR